MANEITLTANIQFAKGNIATVSRTAASKTVTVSGDAYIANTQTVGTGEEALLVGDLGTVGYGWFHNLDGTNFVEIRPGTATADAVKLKPGEYAMFRCAAAPWAIADTASVQLEYILFED